MMWISFRDMNMDNNNTIKRNLHSEFAIIMLLKINEKGAV
ncbi:hypothetical protein EIG88_14875 [Staphylococcus aureus]|nr:hypothetical protein [Staphylococcus aureus]RZI08699.1 hypothetical protein EIG88_14875 [Staphylococcus aureus]